MRERGGEGGGFYTSAGEADVGAHARIATAHDGADLQPQGLDIDAANHVATRLGARTEPVPVASANRIPCPPTGKVDIVLSTLGRTPEHEQVIDFARSHSPFFQAVCTPRGMPHAAEPRPERRVQAAAEGEPSRNGDVDKLSTKWIGRPAGDLPL